MRKSEFYYDLPPDRIAQYPAAQRTQSRLLCLGPGDASVDLHFNDLPARLQQGDVLVFNDTRVIPARLLGVKDTGGRIEALIERVLGPRDALAMVRASKPPKPGQRLHFDGGVSAEVIGRADQFYELRFETEASLTDTLDRIGHIPLPPYIDRDDEPADRERYQTVYAREPGAVAAPTAGLHFDRTMLETLAAMGVEQTYVTLHVGAGTFQPLRDDVVAGQRLHAERLYVSAATCDTVNRARDEGRRIVAVGTTVVRALESAAKNGRLAPFDGETDIFICPGYRFQIVEALITNFHLPESSLLMLVCAFGGKDRVLHAYRDAVAKQYRFYSYGDAMFLTRDAG